MAAVELSLADLEGPGLHRVLAELRSTGPVARVPAVGGWMVTGYRAAVEVMRDPRSFTVDDPRFSTAQVVGPSMLSTDGVEHRRHRAPFVPAFLPGRVEADHAETVDRHVGALLDRVRPAGGADLRRSLSAPLAAGVMASVLGLGDVGAGTVLRWYGAIVAAVTAITAGERPAPEAAEAVRELRSRAVEGGGAALAPGAELDDGELASNLAVVMFGGVETVDGEVANALAHLLARPDLCAAARHDPALQVAVVEESLRLEPAASVVDRYATTDRVVAGVEIAAGDLVRVSIAGANRDPEVFADPDAFDPHRPNLRSQLSFARGPHACVAMDLARLETRAAVRAVLESLPGVHLTGPVEAVGLVFRKPAAVPAAWEAAPGR